MQVTINCVDFQDGGPVAGCDVTCEVTLKPRFTGIVIESTGGGRRVPSLMAEDNIPKTKSGGLTYGAATTLPEQRATTGKNGVVTFSFDVLTDVDRIKDEHDHLPQFHDVAVLIALTGRVAGMVRTSPHILSTTSVELLAGNVHLERLMVVDLAKAIVGHTTGQAARLWFQLHPDPLPGRRYECEIDRATPAEEPFQVHPVEFDGSNANTFVVDVSGLSPGDTYQYRLFLRPEGSREPRAGTLLTMGTFRTAVDSARDLTMYFGSCHKPADTDAYDHLRDLRLWRRLASRDDADMLLLLGDQVYGDSIPEPESGEQWLDSYIQRYNAYWTFRPVRDVIGRIPTYMIPDDHEVTDSWGVDESIRTDRIAAALEAFRIYQLAHGPTGREGALHYHIRRGPVATFMTDGRTARKYYPDAPILGWVQWSAMKRWAASPEVTNADVVVIGCAAPPAILPVEQLEDLADAAATVGGAAAGAILGAAAGFVLGGPAGIPLGASVGAFVGGVGTNVVYEVVEEDLGTKLNAADAWTWPPNQVDLKRLLDFAFDIANDTFGGRTGEHPRLVIILGGDAHIGAVHRITSDHAGDGSDHRRNPQVLQLTSSAIGRNPLHSDEMIELLERFGDDFTLDSDQGEHYRAEKLGLIIQRTLGRLQVERTGQGRTYRIHATVEGEFTTLSHLFDVDLDADRVEWKNLIGQIVATRGVPTLLRVHETGDTIGDATNRLENVEVVFQLDGQPGSWFGFPLRPGADEPLARGMLDTVRTAFNTGTPVRVAYRRTGPANGEAIRVTAQL